MQYQTHVSTSIAAGIGLSTTTDIPVTLFYLTGIALGSVLPDIDSTTSYIGRKAKATSHITKGLFGHRGMTHSLLFSFLFFCLYFVYPNSFTLGLSLGYLFHILGDLFSVSGVPLFLPLTKMKIKIPLYVTGGFREKILFVGSLVFLLYMLSGNPETLITCALFLFVITYIPKKIRKIF